MTIHRLAVLFKPSTNANNKKKNSKEVINCRKNIKKPEYLCSIIKTKKKVNVILNMDISKLTLHSELRLYPKVCAFREPAFM